MPTPSEPSRDLFPPVATYSLVARCPDSGSLGIAVQSHYFSVGATVPWGLAGVGVVATQALVDPAYGPKGLGRMERGEGAADALAAIVGDDPGAAVRQVALIDAAGGVAQHSGDGCIPEAGGVIGDGFASQGNMLASDAVWNAMADAYASSRGPLAERMMDALDAGEARGGDMRGKQSAALLVVAGERGGDPSAGRLLDVRVDDHTEPLIELRRLLVRARAYDAMRATMAAAGTGRVEEARTHAEEATRLAPDQPEIAFWTGIALLGAGDRARAERLLGVAYAAGPGWRRLAEYVMTDPGEPDA